MISLFNGRLVRHATPVPAKPAHRVTPPHIKDAVEEIVQEVAATDPLLKAALADRCTRGMDCQNGPFDPPQQCRACMPWKYE